ncbi:MAG: CotH kinase family protein [Chitinophagales bacterium]|nr:CotH kinase family protein [Chitinophagales bacterium]
MRKNALLFIAVVLCVNVFAQSFYDINTIQEIKIYFGYSNWDYRMDTAKAGSESYIPADSVVVNGTVFLNCGVKYKGNSSYNANRAKNPLHIKLDKYIDQNYEGYEDIKLGNGFSDNSMIREPLAYQILRQYMDAPLGNFARVYINGSYYGIMNNTEDIDSRFLLEHYYSSKHTFFKCNPENAGPGTGNGSSLEYKGITLANYETNYELKSDTGWYELFQLCDTLNNHFEAFNTIADVDRFLWMLAFNNVLVNLDSYSGSFRQNYYLYRNHAAQWIPTIWDLNMCFGGFAVAGGTTSNLTPTTMQTMSYTLHKTEQEWPLLYYLLNDPFYTKMYYAHMRTINNENFVNAGYKATANALHTLVNSAVQTDANYLSTYNNFLNSLTTNTPNSGAPGGTCPGLFPLMDGRANYLSNVLSAAPPVITNVNAGSPLVFGSNTNITAQVANCTNVYLGYRYQKQDRFTRIPMFDDGAHGDGAANDNVYGASVALNSAEVQYYIYAENANTGAFSPERAEYEFYTLKPSLATAVTGQVVINEVTANNNTGIQNEKGKYKDWIELLNVTAQPLGLSGLYLSDDASNLTKWPCPAEAVIKQGEHLVLWADDEDVTYLDMHTNFNLSNSGDAVYLSDGVTVFDSIVFGVQVADRGIARCPDGTGSFQTVVIRTPRSVNDCSSGIFEVNSVNVHLFPNPVSSFLHIVCDEGVATTDLFSLSGERVISANNNLLNVQQLASGCYLIKVTTLHNNVWRGKVIKM